MRYAFWDLIEIEPNYLIGPEPTIFDMGGRAEGAWANGQPETGADIMGYVYGNFDIAQLSAWNFREISQEEALAFCLAINPEAYLEANRKIIAPSDYIVAG